MRRSRVALVALLALLLAGCSGEDHYGPDTAKALQQSVLDVAVSSSGQDYAAALQHLDELEQANDAALQAGELTQARHDAIARSIATVRGDLTQLQSAAQQTAMQQQLQQQQQVQQQQQLQQQQPSDEGNGKGKGNNGKGKGNEG